MFIRTTVHVRPGEMLMENDPRANVIDEVQVTEDEGGELTARKHGADAVFRAIEKFKKEKSKQLTKGAE